MQNCFAGRKASYHCDADPNEPQSQPVYLELQSESEGKNIGGSCSTRRDHKSTPPTPVAQLSSIRREAMTLLFTENLHGEKSDC